MTVEGGVPDGCPPTQTADYITLAKLPHGIIGGFVEYLHVYPSSASLYPIPGSVRI
jgi:hypothetical protein